MKPLSGMWLYINLGFAIVWDSFGFILFIIGLIPGAQPITIPASLVIDVTAFLTDLIFCILYQGYVKIYNVNFRLYQVKRIREMMRLSKNAGMSNNPIAQNLARQTQKINQYMLDKFSNYVINFTVKKIQYSIFTSTVELVPWLGDFSPSWTIKANLHLREHRKTARELKLRNEEFEKSLAKWRGSLRIGGIGKYKSRNNNNRDVGKQSANNIRTTSKRRLAGNRAQSVIKQRDMNQDVRKTVANNIRPFIRKLPSETGQSVPRQKDINLEIGNSAANNIRPFSRQVVGEGTQPIQTQNNNKLANIKSVAGNASFYMGGQLFGSIPQFLEYKEDEKLKDRKSSSNSIRPIKTKVLGDISKPVQSQNNNQDNNNISAANNIKKFNRAQQDQANNEQILETLIKK